MKRRHVLLLAALAVMIGFAAVGQNKKPELLLLQWAKKAPADRPPVAVLIEMGLKDAKSRSWAGRAVVTGAKVVHREGYRFREGDKLLDPDAWTASSHRPMRAPTGMNLPTAVIKVVEPFATVGVVLHLSEVQEGAKLTLDAPEGIDAKATVPLADIVAGKAQRIWEGQAIVRLVTTATPVATGPTEDDFPAAAYGPDGTLWVAYISYHNKKEDRRIEAPPLKEQPADFKALHQPEFGDQLFVKYFKDGKWSEAIAITDDRQDLVRCAIAVEMDGTPWVAYSANRQGNHRMYVRSITSKPTPDGKGPTGLRPGAEQQLTDGSHPALNPAMCSLGGNGSIVLAFQVASTTAGRRIQRFTCTNGKWEQAGPIEYFESQEPNSYWHPSLAGGLGRAEALVADYYQDGDYNLRYYINDNGISWNSIGGSRFEARPSIVYDPQGRLWIAYEEGPEKWGKDAGALDPKEGNPLYFARTVRVVCFADRSTPMRPVAELPPLGDQGGWPDTGQRVEALPRYAYPQIGIDGKGRVWLTYRQKFGSRYSSHPGSYWITFARRLDGDKWTDPIEVHHSDGLLDDRPVLLPHPAGGIRILHNTDGRYTTPEVINNNVYHSYLDLPGEPVEPKLVPHDPGKKDDKLVAEAKAEQEAVQRIRQYRVEAAGKKYQLLRGEFHRHTEVSWDGGPDGSLEDMFRYAIDAAGMDWIGNGDHDNGAGREYTWWLTQKLTDAYHVKDRFTPMFTYERSVSYPHGHRNCMFAQRGVLTLPRLAAPKGEAVGGVHADDTKMLYRYLHEFKGICAVHTSATSMGTDWRDNDPVVEPIVEIYQGDRMSYEKEEAPRAGYESGTGKMPVNIAGWYPKGFVNNALDMGYRLGFQSSSDHFSTHISYCIVLAERHDRQAILDALKKRHVYGATDNIILDVHSGDHMMGDEFKTDKPPHLQIRVHGTRPLARIDIIKDSVVVESMKPSMAEYRGTWTDPKPDRKTHYYYVRVVQTDDEIAWSSPMWIDYAP